VMAKTAADNRPKVFALLCQEPATWPARGDILKVDVVDLLHEIGVGAGLDVDEITQAIADAFRRLL